MRRILVAALAIGALAPAACRKKPETTTNLQLVPVQRRDIVVDAEATGTVEPINVVEIKSKAGGQIVRMPVDVGSVVKPCDLLVQIDTRDVQNQYNQSLANVQASEAKLKVSQAQKRRADELYQQKVITAQEHETATLDLANAQAGLVSARTNLDLAKQRLEDATVRAPVAGTVIEKDVSLGQVISSATGSVSGGTTILKMANLGQVRVRALVNETDIGTVRPGQVVTVTVDAYPDRPFQGMVEKIEPQATVQQSVTMFPVLVSIANREGLLMPGMNGEVAIHVERRDNVLAVPNDAVRNPREAVQVASLVGVPPESVQAVLSAQRGGMRTGNGVPNGAANGVSGAATGGRQQTISRGDVALAGDPQQGGGAQTGTAGGGQGGGARMQLPEATDQDCAAVRAALAKNPAVAKQLDSLRQGMMSGSVDRDSARARSQQLYAKAGVDGRKVMACRFRERQAQGGASGAPGAAGPSMDVAPGDLGPGRAGRGKAGLVFVSTGPGKFEPRLVRLGVSNYDFSEVLSGLKEGEQVALLGAAQIQAQRQQMNERFRNMTGGGVPGMQRQGAGGAGGGGARGMPR